jgi:hypothetical protein
MSEEKITTDTDLDWFPGPKELEPYTSGVVLIPPEQGYIEETGRLPNVLRQVGDVIKFPWDNIECRIIRIEYDWGGYWRKDRRFCNLTLVKAGWAVNNGIDLDRWGLYEAEDCPLLRVCEHCGRKYNYIHNKKFACPYCKAPEKEDIDA